jgi:hypothetical protein
VPEIVIHEIYTRTLEFQDRLGHLPVPNLEETMAKFLRTAQPHLTESEFKGFDYSIGWHTYVESILRTSFYLDLRSKRLTGVTNKFINRGILNWF